MTTLYRPVLIESVEQAEALPDGAILFNGDPSDGETYFRSRDDWFCDGWPGTLSDAISAGRVGLTPYPIALVPIEAEEEWGTQHDGGDPHVDGTRAEALSEVAKWEEWGDEPPRAIRRLVTPWEEQS